MVKLVIAQKQIVFQQVTACIIPPANNLVNREKRKTLQLNHECHFCVVSVINTELWL